MNIHHYYHVYALGNWQQPLNEHIDAVKVSGYRDWETDRKSTRLNSSH